MPIGSLIGEPDYVSKDEAPLGELINADIPTPVTSTSSIASPLGELIGEETPSAGINQYKSPVELAAEREQLGPESPGETPYYLRQAPQDPAAFTAQVRMEALRLGEERDRKAAFNHYLYVNLPADLSPENQTALRTALQNPLLTSTVASASGPILAAYRVIQSWASGLPEMDMMAPGFITPKEPTDKPKTLPAEDKEGESPFITALQANRDMVNKIEATKKQFGQESGYEDYGKFAGSLTSTVALAGATFGFSAWLAPAAFNLTTVVGILASAAEAGIVIAGSESLADRVSDMDAVHSMAVLGTGSVALALPFVPASPLIQGVKAASEWYLKNRDLQLTRSIYDYYRTKGLTPSEVESFVETIGGNVVQQALDQPGTTQFLAGLGAGPRLGTPGGVASRILGAGKLGRYSPSSTTGLETFEGLMSGANQTFLDLSQQPSISLSSNEPTSMIAPPGGPKLERLYRRSVPDTKELTDQVKTTFIRKQWVGADISTLPPDQRLRANELLQAANNLNLKPIIFQELSPEASPASGLSSVSLPGMPLINVRALSGELAETPESTVLHEAFHNFFTASPDAASKTHEKLWTSMGPLSDYYLQQHGPTEAMFYLVSDAMRASDGQAWQYILGQAPKKDAIASLNGGLQNILRGFSADTQSAAETIVDMIAKMQSSAKASLYYSKGKSLYNPPGAISSILLDGVDIPLGATPGVGLTQPSFASATTEGANVVPKGQGMSVSPAGDTFWSPELFASTYRSSNYYYARAISETTDSSGTLLDTTFRSILDFTRPYGDPISANGWEIMNRTASGTELGRRITNAVVYGRQLEGKAIEAIIPLFRRLGFSERSAANLRASLEGKVEIMTPAMRDFTKEFHHQMNLMWNLLKNNSYPDAAPFEENYCPRFYTPETLESVRLGKGKPYEALKESLYKSGFSSDEVLDRMKRFQAYHNRPDIQRVGNLDYSRIIPEPPEKLLLDPITSMRNYFDRVSKRIGMAVDEGGGFGWDVNSKMIDDLTQAAGKEAGDTRVTTVLDQIVQRLTGTWNLSKSQIDTTWKKSLAWTRTAEVMTKLGMAQIINAVQTPATTLPAYGWRAYAKGLRSLISPAEWKEVYDSGAIIRGSLSDIVDVMGMPTAARHVADLFLMATGFSPIERVNQIIDANAAKWFIRSAANLLHKDTADAETIAKQVFGMNRSQILEKLKYYQISDEDIAWMAASGKTTKFIESKMMNTSLMLNQFAHPNVLSRPQVFLDHPFLTQFKGYTAQMGKLSAEFARRTLKGDLTALPYQLIGGGLAADQARALRLFLMGRSIDNEDFVTRTKNAWANVATLGLVGQAWQANGYGSPEAFTRWAVGPVAGDFMLIAEAFADLNQFHGLPRSEKVKAVITTADPALRFMKNLLLDSDFRKARTNAIDILKFAKSDLDLEDVSGQYSPSSRAAKLVSLAKSEMEGNKTFLTPAETKEFFNLPKVIHERLRDAPDAEKAWEYLGQAIAYHMQDSPANSLNTAIDFVKDSLTSKSLLEKMGTDRELVVDGVRWNLRKYVESKLDDKQKAVLQDYDALYKARAKSMLWVPQLLRRTFQNAGLNLNQTYDEDAIMKAIRSTPWHKAVYPGEEYKLPKEEKKP